MGKARKDQETAEQEPDEFDYSTVAATVDGRVAIGMRKGTDTESERWLVLTIRDAKHLATRILAVCMVEEWEQQDCPEHSCPAPKGPIH